MLKPYSRADVEFHLADEIGSEGRNSCVYRAHDPQLDAQLVIKRVEKRRMDADAYFAESACVYRSSHSNVVPIHYACQDADYVYLAMPWYSRGSLKTLMASRKLTVREIIVLAAQFLSGLHHIHSQRLVHFDVKPDNILLSDRGEALVADFGLAKARGLNGLAEQDMMYGRMAPPEAFLHAEFDHRFDIYQAGLTLYRMCVGDDSYYAQLSSFGVDAAFDRERFKHAVVNGQFPNKDADAYPEHIPDALIRVIRKCVTDKDDRYASAIDVVNGMAEVDGALLDWCYSADATARRWEKRSDNSTIWLEVRSDGSSEARKGAIGQERRITEYCVANITRLQIKRFLREH